MTKSEHLQWCKNRALEYVNIGDLKGAFASMASDLNKHPETKDHPGCQLGLMLIIIGSLKTKDEMEKFINGFN